MEKIVKSLKDFADDVLPGIWLLAFSIWIYGKGAGPNWLSVALVVTSIIALLTGLTHFVVNGVLTARRTEQ